MQEKYKKRLFVNKFLNFTEFHYYHQLFTRQKIHSVSIIDSYGVVWVCRGIPSKPCMKEIVLPDYVEKLIENHPELLHQLLLADWEEGKLDYEGCQVV